MGETKPFLLRCKIARLVKAIKLSKICEWNMVLELELAFTSSFSLEIYREEHAHLKHAVV